MSDIHEEEPMTDTHLDRIRRLEKALANTQRFMFEEREKGRLQGLEEGAVVAENFANMSACRNIAAAIRKEIK